MNKHKTRCHNCGESTEQYVCKECELSVCPSCDPNHNHKTAIRMTDGMFGKHEVHPCFFCGEKDENQLAVENMLLGFGMSGCEYSFCVKCLKEKTAYELIEQIAGHRKYSLPMIMDGFDMSNHTLLRGGKV